MRPSILCTTCVAAALMQLSPVFARSPAETLAGDPASMLARDFDRLAQAGQCSRRIGPFATQDTAWQRWRQARGSGHAVSNGIYPCYESNTRGYCFNVFVC